MELILIILCGILMGAFNFGFLVLGYYIRSKKPNEDGVRLTQNNKDVIRNMVDWMNYTGKE